MPWQVCFTLMLNAVLISGVVNAASRQGDPSLSIRVMDGRSGHQISNARLVIFSGAVYPVAMRSVHVREMTADKVGVTQLALSSGLTWVQVWVDGHVACYSNPNYPTANPADRRSGIFSIKEAGAVGVTSMNTCSGSVQVERRPGEIVVFTRPQTFWERFRS